MLDSFKGYIIVEAPDSNVAYEALVGIRHVRGQIRGDLPFKDIEGYLVKKPVVSELRYKRHSRSDCRSIQIHEGQDNPRRL